MLFAIVFIPSQSFGAATGKVTAKIIDDDGQPIQGALVKVTFKFAKVGGVGLNTKATQGKTDDKGLFTAEGKGMANISISGVKEGYYKSGRGYTFESQSGIVFKKWEPWNPTVEVVLKKNRKPIPMYDNHRTTYKIPKFDTPIGFDLEKEDWITPYGRGIISDFIFSFSSEVRAYTDYDCNFTLTFSNPNDGIQEYYFADNDQSYFKWPFHAPSSGYINILSKEKTATFPGKGYLSNEKEHVHYFFRVRTKVDKDGNIQEAMYGKMWGEFGFVPKGKITFRYFLNPDGTTNIEEDPRKNLFPEKMR